MYNELYEDDYSNTYNDYNTKEKECANYALYSTHLYFTSNAISVNNPCALSLLGYKE